MELEFILLMNTEITSLITKRSCWLSLRNVINCSSEQEAETQGRRLLVVVLMGEDIKNQKKIEALLPLFIHFHQPDLIG